MTHPNSLKRYREIGGVLARNGFGWLSKSLEELETTFIELGQMLSTRADVLPLDCRRGPDEETPTGRQSNLHERAHRWVAHLVERDGADLSPHRFGRVGRLRIEVSSRLRPRIGNLAVNFPLAIHSKSILNRLCCL